MLRLSWKTRVRSWCERGERIGLYGFLLFVPCSIAFSQMSLGLLATAFLLECVLKKRSPFARTPINLPLFAFLGIILLTTPFSIDASRSVKDLKNLLIVGIFFLFWHYVTDLPHLRKFTGFLVGCVGVAALYGVIQHYLEVDIFRFSQPISFLKHVNDDLAAPVRVSGFFSIYMTFSGQLAMTLSVAMALLFSVKSFGKRVWLGIALLLIGFALLWTYTRSAWIGAVCALAMFGIMRRKERGGKKWAIFFLLLILLPGVLMLQPELLDKSFSMFRQNDEERIYTWITTLDMIKDHPLTGIGKRNYSNQIQPYRERRYPGFEFASSAHAHNNILQVTVDSGIFAGLAFIWLWGVIFWNMYRTCRRIPAQDASAKWLALGFFGALITFFVQGFLEHNFGDSESAMMMWLYVAFGLKMQELMRDA